MNCLETGSSIFYVVIKHYLTLIKNVDSTMILLL